MERESSARDAAIEKFARVFLHRYGVVFRRCSSARVSRLLGMSWDEFIADWKRAAKFAAVILLEESAANNLPCLRRSACCGPSARLPRTGELITLSAADPLKFARHSDTGAANCCADRKSDFVSRWIADRGARGRRRFAESRARRAGL